jgi:competence protein ComEC
MIAIMFLAVLLHRLWQTRWRLLGIALIAGGAALAPTLRTPDILIGRDAELTAIRGADGELSAVGATRASFELERWLEHDGARRSAEEASKSAAFTCDGIDCGATAKGMTVAVAQHPAAFAEDCRCAVILISGLVSPRGCTAPKTVVDFFAARRQGTHALYIEADGSVRIETVAATRGVRPWSMPELPRLPDAADPGVPPGFSNGASSRPAGLGCRPDPARRCGS